MEEGAPDVNPGPSQHGGAPALSGFESEVLASVRRLGRAGAAEVRATLMAGGHDHPYTTVASALQRLHRRGLLTRDRERVRGGLRYTYAAADDGGALYESFIDRVTEAFGDSAVVRLFDAMGRPSDVDIERLRRRLERED